ncbi:MAG: hypothetical protein M1382_01150 [Candidatus Marsarchaeota archaeon]|nr:hypothetical protein [Candidatus Marsarchaeota archaeon]
MLIVMGALSIVMGALSRVFSKRRYFIAFVVMSLALFALYAELFQASAINLALPHIAIGMNAAAFLVVVILSILLSMSITMNAFAVFNKSGNNLKLNLGSAAASILPSALCCTTAIPSILASFGASSFAIFNTAGSIQGPLATYEIPLIFISIVLLLLSIALTSRSIGSCCTADKYANKKVK